MVKSLNTKSRRHTMRGPPTPEQDLFVSVLIGPRFFIPALSFPSFFLLSTVLSTVLDTVLDTVLTLSLARPAKPHQNSPRPGRRNNSVPCWKCLELAENQKRRQPHPRLPEILVYAAMRES